MEELSQILNLILNGVSNPYLAIGGAVASLAVFIFLKVMKKKWREDKAEREKQKDKARDLNDLEAKTQEADGSVRDRLKKKKTT